MLFSRVQKMTEEVIQSNEANQRLDKYLKKRLPNATTGFLYKMLRKKNIVLNGARAEGSEKVKEGDRVSLFFSEETLRALSASSKPEAWMTDPRYREPAVLHETEDLLFLNKPAGLLSQKAKEADFSANEQLLRYLYEKQLVTQDSLKTFRPAVCNRLDRNTSGILIGGKTLAGLQEAARLLKEKELEKIYHALVHGDFPEEMHTEAYLTKDPRTNQVRISREKTEGAKEIRTDYLPLEHGKDWTLLSVRLLTGKPHQIRAHLQSMGFPVIGDPKYGNAAMGRDLHLKRIPSRQMLHARECTLPDGTKVTAPYPEDFLATLEALRKIG